MGHTHKPAHKPPSAMMAHTSNAVRTQRHSRTAHTCAHPLLCDMRALRQRFAAATTITSNPRSPSPSPRTIMSTQKVPSAAVPIRFPWLKRAPAQAPFDVSSHGDSIELTTTRVCLTNAAVCKQPEPVEECPICLEEFSDDCPAETSACNHRFHAPCLALWHEKSTTCPICEVTVHHQNCADGSRVGGSHGNENDSVGDGSGGNNTQAIREFTHITGVTRTDALNFLDMCDGDVAQAVALFYATE